MRHLWIGTEANSSLLSTDNINRLYFHSKFKHVFGDLGASCSKTGSHANRNGAQNNQNEDDGCCL